MYTKGAINQLSQPINTATPSANFVNVGLMDSSHTAIMRSPIDAIATFIASLKARKAFHNPYIGTIIRPKVSIIKSVTPAMLL